MVAQFRDGDRIFMEKKHPNSWMIHAAESCVPGIAGTALSAHGSCLVGPRHERMERLLSRNQNGMITP
jgi:hypothetical protein